MAGADRLVTGGRAPEIAPPHHGGADKTADHPQFTVHWHSDRAILLHLPCQPVSNGCDSLVGFRFPILWRVADTYCVVVDAGWNRRDRPLALPVAGRGRDFARECDRDGAGRHHWIPTASGQPHGTLPHFRGPLLWFWQHDVFVLRRTHAHFRCGRSRSRRPLGPQVPELFDRDGDRFSGPRY